MYKYLASHKLEMRNLKSKNKNNKYSYYYTMSIIHTAGGTSTLDFFWLVSISADVYQLQIWQLLNQMTQAAITRQTTNIFKITSD